MKKPKSEEQFPLLFIVDNDKNTKNNKGLFFEKGRFNGITSGASAIITEWPNYLNTCWATALICGVTLFILTMMLSTTMTNFNVQRVPKCLDNNNNEMDNRTIHLIHGPFKWNQSELELIEKIAREFDTYQINLIIINSREDEFFKNNLTNESDDNNISNNNNSKSIKSSNKQFDEDNNKYPLHLFHNNIRKLFIALFHVGSNKTMSTTKPKPLELEDLLESYPNIIVHHFDYFELFKKSPLFYKWPILTSPVKIFAIRILQLWQYGGLTFDLQLKATKNINLESIDDFIIRMHKRFENLPSGTVSLDKEGRHMASKVACHAFFGEVLMHFKDASRETKQDEIIEVALKIFCRSGTFKEKYCKYMM